MHIYCWNHRIIYMNFRWLVSEKQQQFEVCLKNKQLKFIYSLRRNNKIFHFTSKQINILWFFIIWFSSFFRGELFACAHEWQKLWCLICEWANFICSDQATTMMLAAFIFNECSHIVPRGYKFQWMCDIKIIPLFYYPHEQANRCIIDIASFRRLIKITLKSKLLSSGEHTEIVSGSIPFIKINISLDENWIINHSVPSNITELGTTKTGTKYVFLNSRKWQQASLTECDTACL